jgi:glycosyltransferase involved in cell wall biosynthesis
MENGSTPFVSAIVPVYNDAAGLKLCLEALENQTYPKSNYEVIVVDNASKNSPEIQDLVGQYHQATYTYQTIPGSYAARNQGISIAKGEVIAFTDADCIPHCDWMETGVDRLLDLPNGGLVGGKIEIFCKNPAKLTAVEVYETVMALTQQEFVEVHKYGATANVFTWKKVIDEVGVFDASLKSSGDVDWGRRVRARNYEQAYAENTRVAHPARSDFTQLYKRTIRHAGGVYDLFNRDKSDFWQQQSKFIQYLAFNLTPPVNFAWNQFFNPQLTTLTQKIQIVYVMLFVRYVTAWELCRLKFGGKSARE